MTVFGLSTIKGRRTLLERAHMRLGACELAVFIGGAVLVGLIGAASGAGLAL